MELLTNKLRNELPALYSQENNPAPVAAVRFIDTLGNWSWYAVEFDGENTFFGLVLGFEREFGYFSLSEFEEVNQSAGFARIQRDRDFQPTPVHDIH